MTKITVFTLTTEGDNWPITTEVFRTSAEAHAKLREYLADVYDGDIATVPDNELSDLFSEQFDGPACIEEHTL
jgi:hypothetical protein